MTEKESKLVEDNLPLARHIAKKWFGRTKLENEDIISAAQYGLVKAAASYDPERGFCFSTYAVRVIENEIRMELRKIKNCPTAISLDAEVPGTEELTYADMVPDKRNLFEDAEFKIWLKDKICGLDERSKNAIMIRIHYPEKSQAECGRMMGISQSLFSRRLIDARRKMAGA